MAVEQDWAAYTDQARLADTDTLLARTSGGAGVEVPGSALVKYDAAGNVGIGGAASEKLDVYGTVQTRAQKAFNGVGFQPYLVLSDSNAGFAEVRLINAGGAAYILTGGTLRWNWSTAGHFLPEADNSYNIGSGAKRVGTYYGATGTINTSDAREKVWRGAMTAAELRAAKRIIAEMGFYQWIAAVDEKGDQAARFHFGPRAQQVWAIMADEGLVDAIDEDGRPGATPYAFLCFDEWAAEPAQAETRDVNDKVLSPARPAVAAGNRFGLRIDQLALFLIAAQEARIAAQDARIAALEAAV